jgi:hypothetical protein
MKVNHEALRIGQIHRFDTPMYPDVNLFDTVTYPRRFQGTDRIEK